MILSCVGYESLIVPSMEYDHSFTWKYKSLAYLLHRINQFYVKWNQQTVICTANVECLPIWMKPSSIKKWYSMPVVREWHMHAKCDQNILCGQELWTISRTANGRTSRRTQIVSIVQTQGSHNSTILKLPLEKGIFSLVVLSCQHLGTAWLVWT